MTSLLIRLLRARNGAPKSGSAAWGQAGEAHTSMFALLREFQASAGVAPNFLVYPDANNAGCTYHTANGKREPPRGSCAATTQPVDGRRCMR